MNFEAADCTAFVDSSAPRTFGIMILGEKRILKFMTETQTNAMEWAEALNKEIVQSQGRKKSLSVKSPNSWKMLSPKKFF